MSGDGKETFDAVRALLRQRRFAATALMSMAITAADYGADTLLPSLPNLSTPIVMLFIIPVIYAALNFGVLGSLLTTGWSMALDVPLCVVEHRGWVRVIQLLHWGLLASVSVFTAVHVDRSRRMQHQADLAAEELRASETKYRRLFENNPVATVLLDESDRVVEANPAACTLFDLPPTRLHGCSLADLLSIPAEGVDIPLQETEFTGVIRGRSHTWVKVVSTPACARADGRQVFLHDVTAEQRWRQNLRTYASSVLRGQEEERRRIAQELHDDTVQTAIQICRQLDTITPLPRSASALEEGIRNARATAKTLIDGLHTIIRSLRPPVLDDLGLVAALRQLGNGLQTRTGTPVLFSASGVERRLSVEQETCVYRIAQEALSNVERHAHARHVQMEVSFAEHRLDVTVLDDGVGFAAPSSRQTLVLSQSLGLLGMYERAELSGSTLTIRSGVGQGTRVEIHCPI